MRVLHVCHWDLSSPDAETIRKLALTRELARRGHELLLRAPGFRFALEVNGIPLQDARLQGIESGAWLSLIGLFSRTTYRLADRIAVVSPEIEANVRAALGPAIEVALVPNGVDLELW